MSKKRDVYQVVYPVAKFMMDRKYPRIVEGQENIPDRPAIYAPNHLQFVDSFLAATSYTEATGAAMRFGAKREYFDGKGIDNHGKLGRAMKWFVENTEAIPVDRDASNPRAFFALQEAVQERIEAGDSVALHPEGTRSLDGRLNRFRSGAARIALALEVPLVPVGIVYTPRIHGKRTDVQVLFGEALTPDEYTEPPYRDLPRAKKAAALSEEIESRVSALTGQERSHEFANFHH